MERSERMKKAYEYLRFQWLAGTQEDVADMLKRQRTNVSSAMNVANSEVLNFVLGQTKGRPRADLPTLQGDNTQ